MPNIGVDDCLPQLSQLLGCFKNIHTLLGKEQASNALETTFLS